MDRNGLLAPAALGGVLRVVGQGASDLARAQARARAIADLSHPRVPAPTFVRMESDGSVVSAMERVDGMDAGALVRARGLLTAGECVALGIEVADALTALHSHGLSHGDVSPSNVMVGRRGAILVDVLGSTSERGTPGFFAPERAVGATPAADVYSLGKLLIALADQPAADRVGAWAEPLISADPAQRPAASMVAVALLSCAEPVPVAVPQLGIAADMRVRASAVVAQVTLKDAAARGWRLRRMLTRILKWSLIGAVAAIAIVALLSLVSWLTPPPQPNADPPGPMGIGKVATPVDQAARSVTIARIDAIARGDSLALAATTAEGSAARDADTALIESLATGAVQFDGLAVTVAEVEVLSEAGRRATVVVTYELSRHTRWDGEAATQVAQVQQKAELDLRWSPTGWLVERVGVVS